jgi:hypothetical protein
MTLSNEYEKIPTNKSIFFFDYPFENSTTCHGFEIELHEGIWQFELWGASVGDATIPKISHTFFVGLGGYSIGYIYLENYSTTFYLTIGGQGLSHFSQRNTEYTWWIQWRR